MSVFRMKSLTLAMMAVSFAVMANASPEVETLTESCELAETPRNSIQMSQGVIAGIALTGFLLLVAIAGAAIGVGVNFKLLRVNCMRKDIQETFVVNVAKDFPYLMKIQYEGTTSAPPSVASLFKGDKYPSFQEFTKVAKERIEAKSKESNEYKSSHEHAFLQHMIKDEATYTDMTILYIHVMSVKAKELKYTTNDRMTNEEFEKLTAENKTALAQAVATDFAQRISYASDKLTMKQSDLYNAYSFYTGSGKKDEKKDEKKEEKDEKKDEKATETAKPAATETAKPATTETAKPATTETAKPAATETTKPAATETTKPAATETTKPATETPKSAEPKSDKKAETPKDDKTSTPKK